MPNFQSVNFHDKTAKNANPSPLLDLMMGRMNIQISQLAKNRSYQLTSSLLNVVGRGPSLLGGFPDIWIIWIDIPPAQQGSLSTPPASGLLIPRTLE